MCKTVRYVAKYLSKQEGNVDPALKPDSYICLFFLTNMNVS